MRVGVLGVGRLGGTLARLLGAHGHEVVAVTSRGREATAELVGDWPGVGAGERDDLAGCDVVILAVPWRSVGVALDGLVLEGTVVVDATNPFSEEFEIIDTGDTGSTGVVAELLPGARVVKAFNTLPGDRLIEEAQEQAPTARRLGLPVAADDVDARDEVADLIGDLGFSAVEVGGLDAGRRWMEPASPLFNVPLPAVELNDRIRQLRS